MNVNTAILDALTGHAIGIERLSNATIRKIIALLKRSDARLLERLGQEDITAISRARQEQLLSDIRQIIQGLYADATGQLKADLDNLAGYEGQYQLDLFKHVVPVQLDWVAPSSYQLIAAANSRPFQGKLLKDWFTDLEQGAFERLRNTIRAGIVEGRTIDQLIREIRGTQAQGYKDGILEINRRAAEVTVRTAVQHTANAARSELYKANGKFIKGVQWVSTLDSRTSAVCRGRDGQVYPVDSGPRPPAHPNCLPGDSRVTPAGLVSGVSKRWFEGEIVTIRTRGGREVSATPNHPILTVGGWKRIGLMDETDKLICVISPERVPAFNGDNQHVETRIKDVAQAFFSSVDVASMPVPTTAPDFHGDGAGSEVAIIGTHCSLGLQDDAAIRKESLNAALEARYMRLSALFALRPFAEVVNAALHAPDSIMGGAGKGLTFSGASPVHTGLLLGGPTTDSNAAFQQDALDGAWTDAEFICNATNADAESIAIDDVVSVKRRDFSGHVFNLETEKHVYYSTGIVIHNCRSSTTPVIKSLKELGIKGGDLPPGKRASMDGAVADDLTYDGWLRTKPKEFQDEVLGKTKADLFRAGLTMDRFVSKAGDEWTLAELKQREAELWKAAFPA